MKTAIEMLIVLWFDRVNAQQINQWASEYIENQNVTLDKEYFELLDSNLNDSENLFVELVKKIDSNFTQSRVLAEIYTAKY
ncbi:MULTISPECIES: hypothetical protein [Acinetobacter]|uniref:Uncharacterized protein n=1 Tax=Acinetobacter piscicola TaxID=2006115 RepID=A0A7S7AJ32_9GAMM|nr:MULTISPECIES: hypothetical protein [Acinetobacter]QOW47341.1 hypothetical protein G0028_16430 [Acinetobacter piscicola]